MDDYFLFALRAADILLFYKLSVTSDVCTLLLKNKKPLFDIKSILITNNYNLCAPIEFLNSNSVPPIEYLIVFHSLCSEELHVHLDQVPSAKKLTKNLASRFIVVIASSDPDLPVIKFYFYAQHV